MFNLIALPLIALIAWLWYEGGGKNAWARDIVIPIVIGLFFCLKYGPIVGIFTAGTCQIIRLGYGAYDPYHDDKPSWLASITHDRNGWWIRAISGAIHGFVAPLPIVFYFLFVKHIPQVIFGYVAFIVINSLSNFLVSRLKANRLVTDLIVGGVFSLILFF